MEPTDGPSGPLDLFAITPGLRADAPAAALEALSEAPANVAARGATKLLLREKELAEATRSRLARELAQGCRAARLELWISEDVELALAVGAAGVQLSERSPSPLVVRARVRERLQLGVSLHRPVSRSHAELVACDHAFLGPLYATPSKPDVAPLGIEGFRELASRLPIPAYAVGGIGERELAELAAAGVRRVAAIRMFFAS